MKLTKTQITFLIFFIFMLLFLLLSIILIVIAGNQIHRLLVNNQTLVLSGTNAYGKATIVVADFPSAFWLIQYGINFIFSMKIINQNNMEILTTNFVTLYQVGYSFLIFLVPVCGFSFLITIIVCLLTWQKATKSLPSTPPIVKNEDNQLLNDLKTNMNQVQDYLIKLNNDVKALKKFTGLITPKAKVSSNQVSEEQIERFGHDLNVIQEKLGQQQQHVEMLKTVDRDEFERTNSGIERPISLVKPTEYIMPKRDTNFVNDFPTQQFLSTKMLTETKSEKKLSLSSIFDRKKIKEELEAEPDLELDDNQTENEEAFKAFPLEFNDPTVIEDKAFREKVGFNLNDYDYTTDNGKNLVEFQTVYQVGDRMIDNGVEYEIMLVVPRNVNDTIMYELTLKSTVDETVKSVIKK
ncbi:hypothetical protein [Spiroplasma poulsonii]|uniref:Uncharacterized protein n=2 Tax=Spiroplasma poulsonii TaxID=2138 RepID=A0A2P6FDP9_9MOLU|nr:hypothetical protein [Spiroplasma poulsonii]KAF0850871.1 putative transmembrane protein [Spiroplasma poulsonii]PQM31494.1 hypothetical protein SMSRO_SF013290 [Spiroplasma poulsonii]PWF96509.1 hypothetical protein SMSE_19560 [Spiroplasma poulsonii]PWF97085.1 hypothetical protein SMH99_18940 [Spiroplasma poulsonii]